MSDFPARKSPEREFLHSLSTPLSTAYTQALRFRETGTEGSPERARAESLVRALEKMMELVRDRRSAILAAEKGEKKDCA